MSIEAVKWALTVPLPKQPRAKLVLLGLAEHAKPDGTEAFPTLDTLAKFGSCSVDTVRRKLRTLEAEGWIRRTGLGPKRQWKWALALSGGGKAMPGGGLQSYAREGGGKTMPPEPPLNRPTTTRGGEGTKKAKQVGQELLGPRAKPVAVTFKVKRERRLGGVQPGFEAGHQTPVGGAELVDAASPDQSGRAAPGNGAGTGDGAGSHGSSPTNDSVRYTAKAMPEGKGTKPPLSVECPTCDAAVGKRCRGRDLEKPGWSHSERWDVYHAAEAEAEVRRNEEAFEQARERLFREAQNSEYGQFVREQEEARRQQEAPA